MRCCEKKYKAEARNSPVNVSVILLRPAIYISVTALPHSSWRSLLSRSIILALGSRSELSMTIEMAGRATRHHSSFSETINRRRDITARAEMSRMTTDRSIHNGVCHDKDPRRETRISYSGVRLSHRPRSIRVN